MEQVPPIGDAPNDFVAPLTGILVAEIIPTQTCRPNEHVCFREPAEHSKLWFGIATPDFPYLVSTWVKAFHIGVARSTVADNNAPVLKKTI